MWQAVLRILLPWLAKFIVAFVENLSRQNVDESFMLRVEAIVRGVEAAHREDDGDLKWQIAFDAARQLALDEGKVVGKAAINTMIELAVQKLQADQVPPDSARTLGSQP